MMKIHFSLLISILVLLTTGAIAWADGIVYGASHTHTPPNQPVRYWKVGVTSKPPPRVCIRSMPRASQTAN
jgi:hypothetical protein